MRFKKIKHSLSFLSPPPSEQKEGASRWERSRRPLLIVAGLGVVIALSYWYWQDQWVITTGRVVSQQVGVGSPLTSRIVSILVREGEHVLKDQVLAKLDDTELRTKLLMAQAARAQSQARLRVIRENGLNPTVRSKVTIAKYDLALAKKRLVRVQVEARDLAVMFREAKRMAKRTKELFLLRAVTRTQWDQAVQQWHTARATYRMSRVRVFEENANVQSARALLQQDQAGLVYEQKRLANQRALLRLEIQRAEAEVELAQGRLDQVVIRAPRNGIVAWLPRKVGEIVDHEDTIVSVLIPEETWVEAYVDGEILSRLREKQEAWVKIDGLLDDYVLSEVALDYRVEKPIGRLFGVGLDRVRSPAQLSELTHSVKIQFLEGIPADIQPEMIAWVWIANE